MIRPGAKELRDTGRVLYQTVQEFLSDGCPQMAAAISFYALFSMAPLLVLVGLGTGLLALAWSSVALTVDLDGLRIRSRVLPVQVSHVPAGQVVGVEVRDLDPMRWGGVGLRALPERTSYIIDQAGGPGIVVHQRDGRRLALQVTEGDTVARTGARTLLRAAGQRLGQEPSQTRPAGSGS